MSITARKTDQRTKANLKYKTGYGQNTEGVLPRIVAIWERQVLVEGATTTKTAMEHKGFYNDNERLTTTKTTKTTTTTEVTDHSSPSSPRVRTRLSLFTTTLLAPGRFDTDRQRG
ncbi:hypothetical protein K504DRAFT_498299 [Pleomassaria siparia CBS 279.74]|uniref:Uncharacterized protein n=1 Tax=Pleomassaria siparia CBS 279.74 TaxID=1314801 RepID=A0A6G1KKX7_9PLEO|nr:hypothetical protein K504DRAFT_498299 [Pleomassaria siparia CBS 279.74]